jgi:hypothetical protein
VTFAEIWLVDFEFRPRDGRDGERPDPVCLVALELRSGRLVRRWRDEFGDRPPYRTDSDALFVAYYASAELGCHLALGWPMPARVLDLFVEFRRHTNGKQTLNGAGLVGALSYFALDGIGALEKEEMRKRVLAGPPYSADERMAILDYCEGDVRALERLWPALTPYIDWPRALLRGRYMTAVARMERAGVPVDAERLALLREHWEHIQDELITEIDGSYQVYEGRSFRADRFAAWLQREGLPWPRHDSGRLDLSDDTFREMSRIHPSVAPLRELRSSLADLRLNALTVGKDGRNRTLLSPFWARTGRNAPSNTRFIFGPSVWLRGLIRPPPGHGIAYVDWCQQEFGTAAASSGDARMRAAYESGDCYLAFAKQAGLVPADATKESHPTERELCKMTSLAVLFGMEWRSLALRLDRPPAQARDLLAAHRETYRTFWRWSDAAVDHAVLTGSISTVFGWTVHVVEGFNPRSLRNFPVQGNGADMMRIAACLATERGIEVCAPVHDAFLICAPLDALDDAVAAMRAAMAEASRTVLDGFALETDAAVVRYPNRYGDPRGRVMWDRVWKIIDRKTGISAWAAA